MSPRIAAVFVVLLVAVSCGNDAETSEPGTTSTTTTSTSTTTTITTTTTTSPPATPVEVEVEVTKDVRYGEDQGEGYHPALLDVYAPVQAGPWPTVVMLHGGGGQFQTKNALNMQARAEAVAVRGAVVFVPNVGGVSADPNARDFRILSESTSGYCATAFAAARAGEFGGDPDEFVLTGFSGGANTSAIIALADQTVEAPPCEVAFAGVEPDRLVLWEGDYVLAPWWDDALEANPDFYDDQWIWGRLDAASTTTWHLMIGDPDRAAFQRVPVGDPFGTGSECDRPLDGEEGIPAAGGTCRFFELRDPTGDLRRDADGLDLFDDGWFTIGDFSLLLAHRLQAAGIDSTTTIVDGPTTHSDLTPAGLETYVDLVVNG